MKTNGSGQRVLRFAVTGALLGGGSLACDSAKTDTPVDAGKTDAKPDEQPPKNVNVRRVEDPPEPEPEPTDPPIKVNPGPEEPGGAAGPPIEENVNEGPVEEPPKPEPEKRVNPGPVKEPPPRVKTNVGRVRDPKAP